MSAERTSAMVTGRMTEAVSTGAVYPDADVAVAAGTAWAVSSGMAVGMAAILMTASVDGAGVMSAVVIGRMVAASGGNAQDSGEANKGDVTEPTLGNNGKHLKRLLNHPLRSIG